MGLPLNLAMTPAEISACQRLPEHLAWMACHFSPYGQGLANIPDSLPAGSMLILNDRLSCGGHCPGLVSEQLSEAVARLRCETVLLDFQRPPDGESQAMAEAILSALPCPAAVTEAYAGSLSCPVFLAPAPLHIPLRTYLAPWAGREIWLEAALCQEAIVIVREGVSYVPQFPPEGLSGGFDETTLRCQYQIQTGSDAIRFTLFDTRDSLAAKLSLAETLGVSRCVGLWQELGQ